MAGARRCPGCGNPLRRTDFPDHRTVVRFIAIELVLWAAVAFVLAFLASPGGEGEASAFLGAVLLLAWILLRPRQQAALHASRERASYSCDACLRRFEGEGLRERKWHM